MQDITQIDIQTELGKYLLMAISKITSESQTDKTPNEVLAQLSKLKEKVFTNSETYGSKGSDDYSEQTLKMVEKSEKPINLYDLLKKVAEFWHGSEIPKPIFKQYLSEHNLDEIATSSHIEISDEKILIGLKNSWSDYEYDNGNLYSTTYRDGWLMAIDWYKQQLKLNNNGK